MPPIRLSASHIPSQIMELVRVNDAIQIVGSFSTVAYSPYGSVPIIEIDPQNVALPRRITTRESSGNSPARQMEEDAVLRLLGDDSGGQRSSPKMQWSGEDDWDVHNIGDDGSDGSYDHSTNHSEAELQAADPGALVVEGVPETRLGPIDLACASSSPQTRHRSPLSEHTVRRDSLDTSFQEKGGEGSEYFDSDDEVAVERSEDGYLTDGGLTRRLSDASLVYVLNSTVAPSPGDKRRLYRGDAGLRKSPKRRRF